MTKISLYSFKAEAIIATNVNDFFSDQERDLTYRIKQIDEKKFIFQENSKKKIIFLNELFFINDNMFILVDDSIYMNLISADQKGIFKCSLLSNKILDFIKSFMLLIFSAKMQINTHKISLIKTLIYIFIVIFIMADEKSVSSEEQETKDDYSLQSNIYLGYQDIKQRAYLFQEKTKNHEPLPIKNKIIPNTQKEKKHFRAPIDSDTLFFFNLKERYAKK